MGTVNQEEQLTRIADALEGINCHLAEACDRLQAAGDRGYVGLLRDHKRGKRLPVHYGECHNKLKCPIGITSTNRAEYSRSRTQLKYIVPRLPAEREEVNL